MTSTVTDIDICNRAMVKLGAGTIQSLNDNTTEAQTCAALYDGIKRDELAAYPWSFANANLELNQLTDAPLNKSWQYSYQLPSDFVRVRNFYDAGGFPVAYYVNADTVWANTSQLFCEYTQNVSESAFPDYFIGLLVARVAWEAARKIIGLQSDIQTAAKEYSNKRAEARNTDANENIPESLVDPSNSSLIRARHGAWF